MEKLIKVGTYLSYYKLVNFGIIVCNNVYNHLNNLITVYQERTANLYVSRADLCVLQSFLVYNGAKQKNFLFLEW